MAAKKNFFGRTPNAGMTKEDQAKAMDDWVNRGGKFDPEGQPQTPVAATPEKQKISSKQRTKRVVVDITPEEHRALKSYCVEKNTTVAEVVRKYLSRLTASQKG